MGRAPPSTQRHLADQRTFAASPAVGTVTGTLFNDLNGNGTMDPGEKGIPEQTVFIDENNNSKLDPSGLRVDTPGTGSYSVAINPGQTLSNLDFANTPLAQISGTVFVDSNGNGHGPRGRALRSRP